MAHPVIWSSKSFFYPIGNTPAASLTEHIPPEEDATVLVLGCGDPRSTLYTIDLEDKHPLKRNLDITFCDLEPGVLARNIIIYTLLIDRCDDEIIQRVWKIYLDVFIDEGAADLVISQCTKLLELTSDMDGWVAHPYGKIIKFCTMDTVLVLRRFWDTYIATGKDMKQLKPEVLKDMHEMHALKTKDMMVTTAARSAGIMAMDMVEHAVGHFRHYWTHGVTDTETKEIEQATHVNSTLLYSSSGSTFNLHYGTDPIMCFHLAPALASVEGRLTPTKTTGAIVSVIKLQFATWCRSFVRRSNCKGPSKPSLQLRFFAGNALTFCKSILSVSQSGNINTAEYTRSWGASTITFLDDYAQSTSVPAPVSFNVIETSNLSDHLGPLNLLLVTSPLLRRDASSVLFTHSLTGTKTDGGQNVSALDGIGVELPLLSLLFGLVPERMSSDFTSQCLSHELVMGGFSENSQFLELNAWRVVSQTEPGNGHSFTSDPHDLAKSLFKTYLHMFQDERSILAFLQLRKSLTIDSKHFVRDSFICFLIFVKQCYVGDWEVMMDHLMRFIETDRTLLVGLNSYQDLCRGLHLAGLRDIMPSPASLTPSTRDFVFRSWEGTIPNAVYVSLVIPRAEIQDLIDDSIGSKQIRTPTIQCEIACPGGDNVFSSFQPTFGTVHELEGGRGPHDALLIDEDLAGWAGNGDLIVHFPVPAWILVQWPADQYRVSLAMFPDPDTSSYYASKLGLRLTIYSTTLANSKRAFILRDRPRATSQSISQHGNLSTSPIAPIFQGIVNRQLVTLLHQGDKVSSFTIRCPISDYKAKAVLADKGTQVRTEPLSIFAIRVAFKEFESILHYPYPVNHVAIKTRIARKSSYIEVEAQVALAVKASLGLSPFPVLRTRGNNLWQTRMHYIYLDALPRLRCTAGVEADKWLRPHLGISLNEEKQQAEASGKPGPGFLDLKESLTHVYVRCVEDNRGKPILFKLSEPKTVGTWCLLFVSNICIDLTGHTVVADACVLTLTFEGMGNPYLQNALSGLVGQAMVCADTATPEEEVKWWKVYLPTAVERCRTWTHKKNCEYTSAGIPRSLEMGTDPICSCGRGKDLGDFTKVAGWTAFTPFVTRVALGMPFPMSLLGDTASKLQAEMGKAVDTFNLASSENDDICVACGQPGKPKLLACSACKSVRYCSSTCQKAHWKKHKVLCSIKK